MSLHSNNNQHIPLKDVNIDINVINNIAEFTIYQLYENNETPAEIFYKFPTPAGASVYHFQATIDDKIVKTVIKEKEEAKKEYNGAITQGHNTFMLNYNEGDVFSCCIGNVDKNKKINIEIKYSVELKTEITSSQLRLVIPLTIMPRYVPSMPNISNNPNTTLITDNPYKQSINASIFMSDGIESLDCNSDTLMFTDKTDHTVKFKLNDINKLDHDVNIIIKRKPQRSVAITELWKDVSNPQYKFATMLNIVPDFDKVASTSPENIHYTLIIDRSGSMQGNDLENAKDGAMMFINQLPDNASFDIYHFGSDFRVFKPISEFGVKDQAVNWISKIYSYGGTELLPVMTNAYSQIEKQNKPGVIIVLTDGGISNVESVIKLVRSNPNVNVFSIGIGNSVSKQLVMSLAEEGHGKAEFVDSNNDQLQEKVISLLLKSQQSVRKCQKDNKINVITDGPYKLIPDVIPILYENDVNTFYVFSAAPVKAIEYSTTITKSVPVVEIFNDNSGYPIHRLAGIRLINHIQYGKSGSQIEEVKTNVIKELIAPISISLGILSQFTSFIGVEYKKDGDKLIEQTVLKTVPLRQVNKYEYIDECVMMSAKSCRMNISSSFKPVDIIIDEVIRDNGTTLCSSSNLLSSGINMDGVVPCPSNISMTRPTTVNTLCTSNLGTTTIPCSSNISIITPSNVNTLCTSNVGTTTIPCSSHVPQPSSYVTNFFNSRIEPLSHSNEVIVKSALKLTIDKFNFEYKHLGSDMLTSIVNEELKLPVNVGDLIEITDNAIKGIYKVLCLGSNNSKWVLKRFEF